MLTVADLLDLNDTIAADLFAGKTYPWEALEEIGDYIRRLRRSSTILRRMSGLRRTPRSFPPPTSAAPASLTTRRRSAIAPSFGVAPSWGKRP